MASYYQVTATQSIASSTTGVLCASASIYTGTASGNTNFGAYNFDKVSFGGYTYEIECNMGMGPSVSNAPIPNVGSFEACIAQCNTKNAAVAFSCLGAAWSGGNPINTGGGACGLYTATGTALSTSLQIGYYSARLINSNGPPNSYPLVTDAVYLQPTPTSAYLGLCTNTAYAYQTLAPQWTDGTYGNEYELECGQYWLQPSASSVPATSAIATLFPVANKTQNTEDCLRACDWQNRYYGTSMSTRCVYFIYQISTMGCTFWTGSPSGTMGYPSTKGGASGSNYMTSTDFNGGWWYAYQFPGFYDRPTNFGYKKRGLPSPERIAKVG